MVTVTVTDVAGETGQASFIVSVLPVNDAPVVDAID